MRRSLTSCLTAVAAAALAVLVLVAPAAAGKSVSPRYYLAVGDSLSQGVQPSVSGLSLESNEGYADQLYASLRTRIRNLKLVKLGCPGDTTTSMLTGKGNSIAAKFFHCDRTGGSQVKAAQRFLKAHHSAGQVALVTIDIGANDVDGCASPGVNTGACVAAGLKSIKANIPKILAGIKQAVRHGTPLAGMNLYDPVLGGYFSTTPSVRALASASIGFLKSVNNEIAAANRAAGFKTADVADAFASYSTATVPFGGRNIPLNVARVCSWTWACTTPPSGPNIHANRNGYSVIAAAFQKVLGRIR